MTEITFKNVGQGDSILLKWEEGIGQKIGIIDCRKYASENPILEEIKILNTLNKIEIEFFFISHGHEDHYSGVNEVIDYCENHQILIKNFISTLHPSQFEYFEIVKSRNEKIKITKLLQRINDIVSSEGIIEDAFPAINKNEKISIGNYVLECLYPRQRDYTKLGKELKNYILKKRSSAPNLNYISTVIKISNKKVLLLLTSDCLKETLDFCMRKDTDLQKMHLHLGQVPHHGSKHNHNQNFWSSIRKMENCPVVISSGRGRDNLPDLEVVKGFTQLGYQIYSTNFVNGVKEFVTLQKENPSYEYILDVFTDLEDEYSEQRNDRFVGDKKFKMSENSLEYLPIKNFSN